jgi:ectoine hydroxylase-related dioxygenase (phytanoyl-CoA dioxygenase family)
MGNSASRRREAGKKEELPALEVPAVDRERTSIADKEATAEMAFMLENMRMKTWAAEGDNIEQVLSREDNSAFRDAYVATSLPLDQDGFVKAHDADDSEAIRATFDALGLVVIRDAISAEDCTRSVDELWGFLERQCKGLDRNNPRTWDKWPALSKLGILGNTFVLSPQFYANRQSARIHRSFAALFGIEQLHVNTGRASAMRPTRGVRLPADETHSEEVVDKPEWRSKAGEDWLHWDMNPFTGASSSFSWRVNSVAANRGYGQLRTQGILALSDCASEDGGFFCVPGSHKVVRSWAAANTKNVADNLVVSPESGMQLYLPKEDPLRLHAQRAPIRAGDLLIWDARLLHCNYPNNSDRLRMVQYMQMKRADDPAFSLLLQDRNLLPPEAELALTPLGERLLGFAPWG